ncbi:hypothetical protein BKD02_10400 [Brucella sp. 09RB8910]|nr:hypothetical protein BKD02_10400 [Brucella sp. 09RB8910]
MPETIVPTIPAGNAGKIIAEISAIYISLFRAVSIASSYYVNHLAEICYQFLSFLEAECNY